MLHQISALCRTETVLRRLKSDMEEGHFPVGSRLGEVALASRYGVSRTPVREALTALAAMGWVERSGRRGCKVAARAVAQTNETCPVCGAGDFRLFSDSEGIVLLCRKCHQAWVPGPAD